MSLERIDGAGTKILKNLLLCVTGALQITGCDVTDQGKYECVANNSVGTEYSKSAMLYVKGMIPERFKGDPMETILHLAHRRFNEFVRKRCASQTSVPVNRLVLPFVIKINAT